MSETIIPGDKRLRRQVLIGCVLLLLVGALAALGLLDSWEGLKGLVDSDPLRALIRLKTFAGAVVVANAAASFGLAMYFLSIAARIMRSGRYPPEGMRVVRDTPVRVGAQARWKALVFAAGALAVLSTNVAVWFLYRFAERWIMQ